MAASLTMRSGRHFLTVAAKASCPKPSAIIPSCHRFQSTASGVSATTSTPAVASTTTSAPPRPTTAYSKPAYTSSSSSSSSSSTNSAPTAGNAFKDGLKDAPSIDMPEEGGIDWARSFSGLSEQPFSKEIADILLAPLPLSEIEIKPDGIIYLPEIKYRRILNLAFGPGAWGLAPRSDTIITNTSVTREYGLVCHGRLVSVARGEQDYFDPSGIPTATEGCKSNALMRTCKDLGIASELWDPRFIRKFRKEMCQEVMSEHLMTKKRKKLWIRKGDSVEYPYKQV